MSRPNQPQLFSKMMCLLVGLCAVLPLISPDAHALQAGKTIDPPPVLIDTGVLETGEIEDPQRDALAWGELEETIKPTPWPEVQARPGIALSPIAADMLKQADTARKQGEVFRAIELLREASVLEPDHPEVDRALGLAYAESGNLTRAASFLREVVAANPNDAEALVALARHSAQSEPIEQVFADCLALEKIDGGQVIAYHFRAIALKRLGYTAAATEQLARLIETIRNDGRDKKVNGTMSRERRVIEAMSSRLSIDLGDLYLRAGQYKKSDEAYANVEVQDPTARNALVARRIYLAMLADDQAGAVNQAIDLLSSQDVVHEDAQLVSYLVAQGVSKEIIAERIGVLLEQKVVLPRLVALAMVAEKPVVLEQISAWLSRETLSADRLEQAVGLIEFDDDDPADAQPLADLLRILAERIKQSPEEVLVLARAAIGEIDAPVTLLRAIQTDTFAQADDAYDQLIVAVAYESTGRLTDSVAAYQGLMAADELLAEQVKLPLVRLQLALGVNDEPLELLGEPDIDADWETFELSLRAMANSGKAREALDIIDRYIKQHGKELKSDVLRIEMIAMMGQPQEACNLLLRLISNHPEKESLYLLGIDLSFNYRAYFSRTTDADRMRRAFLARLLSNLPDSELSRIAQAQSLLSNPTLVEEAEQLLLQVIKENPKETTALSMLVEHYDKAGDQARATQMHERYIQSIAPGISRAILIAERAVKMEQPQKAVDVIEKTLKFEKQGVLPGRAMTASDASMLLHRLEAADPDRETDELYLAMIRRFPDDAGLNNALGYRWTVQNNNLLQAKAMIERALKQEPMNHSLLDSLAWVQYKLGDFEKAYTTQSRALMVLEASRVNFRGFEEEMGATIAILNDHMGDILYKLDDTRKALNHWREAGKQSYSKEDMQLDPELLTLQDRLKAKIDALANDQPVPVAQVPGPEARGPAGHPAENKAGQDPEER